MNYYSISKLVAKLTIYYELTKFLILSFTFLALFVDDFKQTAYNFFF